MYNLEQWDGKCIFEWNRSLDPETNAQNEKNELEDIKIRSRRVRVRAGQTSKQVLNSSVLFLLANFRLNHLITFSCNAWALLGNNTFLSIPPGHEYRIGGLCKDKLLVKYMMKQSF